MNQFNVVLAVGVAALVGVSGCKSAKQEVPAPASQSQPAGNPAQAGNPLSGKIVETMDSGGYTYVCLENSGMKTWVAMPLTKITLGKEVTCQPGMEMKNFTSKTLNRTFPSIYFSGGIR